MDKDEMMARAVLAGPDDRIWAMRNLDEELRREDLSIRERADLLDQKMKLNTVHQNMLRLGR